MFLEFFWLPKMNNDVEDLIKTCPFYQTTIPSSQFELLNPIYTPPHPWKYLYADLHGPFHADEYIFTVIDAYSRYPETGLLKDTSSKSLIKELESVFSRHGCQ